MNLEILINFAYVVAAGLFIFGLKLLSHPSTARRGNLVSAVGMFVAVVVTLLDQQIISYHFIVLGVLVGGLYGAWKAKSVQMTQMPEMVSLFNGFGGDGAECATRRNLSASTYRSRKLRGKTNLPILDKE